MSDDATLPPRRPNTPRVWIAAVRAFAAAHPDWMIVLVFAVFVAGAVLL